MADTARLIITGASGSVGQAIIGQLQTARTHPLHALGRNRPAGLRPGDQFHELDLADPAAVGAMGSRITDGAPVTGLICVAGMDCRTGLGSLDPTSFRDCMQVNCLAHLQLLQAICQQPPPPAPLPVVLVSSDVVGQQLPGTLAYAAAKAASEEVIRHAAADLAEPGAAVLIMRLPDIGIPMRAGIESVPSSRRADADHPLPVLAAAVRAVTRFVTRPPATASLETWHA